MSGNAGKGKHAAQKGNESGMVSTNEAQATGGAKLRSHRASQHGGSPSPSLKNDSMGGGGSMKSWAGTSHNEGGESEGSGC